MLYKHVLAAILYPALALSSGAAYSASPQSSGSSRPPSAAIDMAPLSKVDVKKYAASHFLGFYMVNGSTVADVCKREGVDLTEYVDAFKLRHTTELAQANKIMVASGIPPEKMAAIANGKRQELEALVRQTMLDLASALHRRTIADGCTYISSNVADAVSSQSYADLNPDVEAALMSD